MINLVKFIKVLNLLIWIGVSLYVGVGGYVKLDIETSNTISSSLPADSVIYASKQITFRNKEELQAYKDEELALIFFRPMMVYFPQPMLYLLTAMSFGALGAITALMKDMALKEKSISSLPVNTMPFLGSLTGLVVLGISNLIPGLVLSGEKDLRPLTLAFFSLLAGLFAENFFNWLSRISKKIFE